MESLAEDLATMVRRPLQPHHISAMQKAGTEVAVPAGTMVLHAGALYDTFRYVLSGEIELVDTDTGLRTPGTATLGPKVHRNIPGWSR